MPDIASQQLDASFDNRQPIPSASSVQSNLDPSYGRLRDKNVLSPKRSSDLSHPEVIEEGSEPASPDSPPFVRHSPSSALTDMLRKPPGAEEEISDLDEEVFVDSKGVLPVVVGEGIISQPNERTSLLLKTAAYALDGAPKYGSMQDVESQKLPHDKVVIKIRRSLTHKKERVARIGTAVLSPKSWDKRAVWVQGVRKPAGYIPSVILGLLLNILDALSYGTVPLLLGHCSWLNCHRHDFISAWPAHICRSWSRWDFHVLRKLYCVTARVFPRGQYFSGRYRFRNGRSSMFSFYYELTLCRSRLFPFFTKWLLLSWRGSEKITHER